MTEMQECTRTQARRLPQQSLASRLNRTHAWLPNVWPWSDVNSGSISATIAKYRSLGMNIMPSTGLFPAVVPGAFDAWMLLLRDFGTRSLADVLVPAIEYARDGIPLSHEAIELIKKSAERFRSEWTALAQIYLPNGEIPEPGTLLHMPPLAETYAALL